MIGCLECGISSGCGCDVIKGRVKHTPRDHEKEAKRYQQDLKSDIELEIYKEEQRNKRINQ